MNKLSAYVDKEKVLVSIGAVLVLLLLGLGVLINLDPVVQIIVELFNTFFPIMIILFIVELVAQAFGFSLIKRLMTF